MLKEKIKQIDGKSYYPAKVIMLPAKEKAEINSKVIAGYNGTAIINGIDWNNKLSYGTKVCEPTVQMTNYHLYLIADDKIRIGDRYLVKCFGEKYGYTKESLGKLEAGQEQLAIKHDAKKVIVSTNTSLGLPSLSEGFISKYIESYNKGEMITDVMVEVHTAGVWEARNSHGINGRRCVVCYTTNAIKDSYDCKCGYTLKVDKSNSVTIRKVKDTWTREEVIELCSSAFHTGNRATDMTGSIDYAFLDKFIEENL